MALLDEIERLKRILRVQLRFSGADNPAVSGSIGGLTPNLYGKVADATGDYPVTATVASFGTYNRALTNIDQGFESPSISTTLTDPGNVWRQWVARAWTILGRTIYYVLRAHQNDGLITDADVAWGHVSEIELPAGQVVLRAEQLAGDFFGKKLPRRKVTLDDWPNADPNSIGRGVPIVYGKLENSFSTVLNFTGSIVGPSGAIVTGLTATPAAGGGYAGIGTAPSGYYAVAPVATDVLDDAGTIIGAPVVVGPVSVTAGQKVTLAWSYSGPALAFRIWRGNSADFAQMDRYRYAHAYLADDVPYTITTIDDLYPGYDNRDPPPNGADSKWDLNYRQQIYYWLSPIVSGTELAPVGPLQFFMSPVNRKGQRKISLTWTAVAGATGYKLRRAVQVYHYDYGFDREWSLGVVTSHEDFLNDTSAVDIPDGFGRARAGAVECLLVDTNPNGTAGEYTYLVAGHPCKEIREVYVTKSPVKASGNPVGALDRPYGVSVSVVGTAGTTVYRYKVSARNGVGETLASSEVRATTGNATLTGGNYNTVAWNAVTGAESYSIYRAADAQDFRLLVTIDAATSYNDTGAATLSTTAEPENNTTSLAYASAQETTPATPVLQTKDVDYDVVTITANGNVYQCIRFLASQEGNPVTCNVWGVEAVGDSTGNGDGTGLLITNSLDQFKHFLLNWVFNSFRSGNWFDDTGYTTGLLDTNSFEQARVVSELRVTGGYIGAGIISEETDARQVVQDWVISCDVDWYYWDGKFHVSMFTMPEVDRATLPQFTPQNTIFRDSFVCRVDATKLANYIQWQAGPQYDGWFLGGVEQDATYQAADRYGRVIEAPIISLMWTRDLTTARDIIQRRLSVVKNPPLYATFLVPLSALNDEIASLVAVTHPDGVATDGNGWVSRVCKIIRSDVDFDRMIVSLEVQDYDDFLGTLGYARLGDRTWDPLDTSYTTSTEAKQGRYAYLADRASGVFSDGDPGKRLA